MFSFRGPNLGSTSLIYLFMCNHSSHYIGRTRIKHIPLNVVLTVITNKMTDFNKIKHALVQKCPVYLQHLWLGGISERFAKWISQIVQRCYFSVNVRVVFHTEPILTSIHKDVLPPHHNNSLIYLSRCSCSLNNIGRTNLRLDS